MAVTVKNGGTFTKSAGDRPGLYVRFVQKALAAIASGARSKVGMLKTSFTGGTAIAETVYRITSLEQAQTLFGATNVQDVEYALIGGASEVVVMATAAAAAPEFTTALGVLESYEFHVFVSPPGATTIMTTAAYSWLSQAKTDGKNFIAVWSNASDEGNTATIGTAVTGFKDEYSVFVGNGVVDATGTQVASDLYACYIAGLIAGTSINGSLTYYDVPFADVITRFKNADVKTLLTDGVLLTTIDGDKPHIEQGLTLGNAATNEFTKIRTVRAKQAMVDDISSAVNDNYIGKITNNVEGQIAVVNAIKAYLETLANNNVIDSNYTVAIDTTQASINSDLYIVIGVKFLDSIEYVYLTISV